MEIVFLLSAELDLFQAYEIHGEPLHTKIDAALKLLVSHPEMAPSFGRGFRRKLVLRSPFAIYYTIEGQRMIIHGVINQREDPKTILARLRDR
jgi:plasmid stabilization system protein ParE